MPRSVDVDSHTPRAPNKASKATIADLRRYLVSHKAKDDREPCTPRDLAMSQNCNPASRTENPQEVFVHARQQPPTRSVSLLEHPPSLLSTNPTTPQANHLRSVWTFSPMVGRTDSQDKRISHAPLFDGVLMGRESYPPSQKLRRDRVSREAEIPDAWVHTEVWKTSLQ